MYLGCGHSLCRCTLCFDEKDEKICKLCSEKVKYWAKKCADDAAKAMDEIGDDSAYSELNSHKNDSDSDDYDDNDDEDDELMKLKADSLKHVQAIDFNKLYEDLTTLVKKDE